MMKQGIIFISLKEKRPISLQFRYATVRAETTIHNSYKHQLVLTEKLSVSEYIS